MNAPRAPEPPRSHPLLLYLRGNHAPPGGSLEEFFRDERHQAWSLARQVARQNPAVIDDELLALVETRRAEATGAFFALLLDVAHRDEARRPRMIEIFRRHVAEHPGPALGSAGYNLHEYNRLLDRGWIAIAREHFDADPEGAWGIFESAAMYQPHVIDASDVDWFESRRAAMPRDYFVSILSLAGHWEDRRAGLLSRALANFDDHPAEAVEAAAFTARSEAPLQTPELVSAVLRHFRANPDKAWEFFDGACRTRPEAFDDALLDAIEPHGPGSWFPILRHLVDVQPERAPRLLDRYAAGLRRHPKEGIERARYAFDRDDARLLRPDLLDAVCAGFAAAPYAAYELLWTCVDRRPELVGPPQVATALANIPNATNRAFGFFAHLLKMRPDFTRECTLAVFECLAVEPAHRAFNRAEFLDTIVTVSQAAHIKTGLELALREPPQVGSRRARALMAILFREKLRSRRHVLLEALRHAGGIVLWHKVAGESEKFCPVWDFFLFIIDHAADESISTAAAERFLEGAFQLSHLVDTSAQHETFLRRLDLEDADPRPWPSDVEFLAGDADLDRLWRIVSGLAARFGDSARIRAIEEFRGRMAAARRERDAAAARGVDARVKSLDARLAIWGLPGYAAAFGDAEAERSLPEEARIHLRREKKDLAKRVRDALRAEAVRIAVTAVERTRLDLYRSGLRKILGREVDIATVEPRILPSFLWFQAVEGLPRNAKGLRRLIEDRIEGRSHHWMRTEPAAAAWAERVTAAFPNIRLERWRAEFAREVQYRPRDAAAEKRRRIKSDLAQARELLEKAGARPASDSYEELTARLAELRAAGAPKVDDEEKRPPPDPELLAEAAMNLERVRLVELTPDSDFEGRITLTVETDPFEVLFMGEYGFASCLSLRGSNAWSAVSNAIDIDKVIVWAREPGGNVVGRRLLALTPDGILQYRTYSNRHGLALDGLFESFVAEYAAHVGAPLTRSGRAGPLLSDRWYDDGAV